MGKPVSTNITCDMCGQAWSLHIPSFDPNGNESVNDKECIRVLKAELAKCPQVRESESRLHPKTPFWNETISSVFGNVFKND